MDDHVEIKVGDHVRLRASVARGRRAKPGSTVVNSFLNPVTGGVRLETPLDGSLYWNVKDLCHMARPPWRRRKA
jgi:hypothetical protein